MRRQLSAGSMKLHARAALCSLPALRALRRVLRRVLRLRLRKPISCRSAFV
jgi:hypothetical protein